MPSPCRKTKHLHNSDVKYILSADSVIYKIPCYQQFDRKTKLRLNPDYIPDLGWQFMSSVSTNFVVTSSIHTYAKSNEDDLNQYICYFYS